MIPKCNDQRNRSRAFSGFTLIELLIVITIIGIMMGLLLPVVNRARDTGRKTTCQNNMMQIGKAFLSYNAKHRELPPAFYSNPKHNWMALLLRELDLEAVANKYRFKDDSGNAVSWKDPINADIIQFPIPVARCPAAPGGQLRYDDDNNPIAATDYAPFISGVAINKQGTKDDTAVNPALLSRLSLSTNVPYPGALRVDRGTPMSLIRDGQAYTLLALEDAGRPENYVLNFVATGGSITGAGWADPDNTNVLHGMDDTGTTLGGGLCVNVGNNGEPYSFHQGGFFGLYCDGRAHFLPTQIDIKILVYMITRDNSDVVPPTIFTD